MFLKLHVEAPGILFIKVKSCWEILYVSESMPSFLYEVQLNFPIIN